MLFGPAAASWGSGRIDIFVIGSSKTLVHRYYFNGWSAWEDLGGTWTSEPAVAVWELNRLDVFVRGTDNALHHLAWFGAAWSGWENLGGTLNGGPAVASWGANRLDVFTRGNDNSLYHIWFDGKTWSAWEEALLQLQLFLLGVLAGPQGTLFAKYYYYGAWSQWSNVGGDLT